MTKNPHFAKFHPLDQGRAQIDRDLEIMKISFICIQENKIWSTHLATVSLGTWVTEARNLDVY